MHRHFYIILKQLFVCLANCIGVFWLLRITLPALGAIRIPHWGAFELSLSPKKNNALDDSIDMPWHVLVSALCCLKAKQMVLFLSFSVPR